MKNETQPQHTQGELEIGNVNPCEIRINGTLIAKTFVAPEFATATQKQAEANAQRIVNAVNMHDEFMNGYKKIKLEFNGIDERDLSRAEKNILSLCERLLKQAEQK